VNEPDTWQPVTEVSEDVVTPATAEALHNLLDSPGPPPGSGDPIPPLWHWLAFLPRGPQRELARDGHPKLGAFMPPVPPSRRMFAGGQLSFRAPLIIGEPMRRTSTVTSIERKTGRTGSLIFVEVSHDYAMSSNQGSTSVHEQQDIVYRAHASATAAPVATVAAETQQQPVPNSTWQWDLRISPTLLFRFSALTYNAHRIHYDREYATKEEGYPGLVVHGPLQAIALAELARRNAVPLSSFHFRAVHPAFDDGSLQLRGERIDEQNLIMTSYDCHGALATRAEALVDPDKAVYAPPSYWAPGPKV
jgi:3-methylfumaryl-CoA hydratase